MVGAKRPTMCVQPRYSNGLRARPLFLTLGMKNNHWTRDGQPTPDWSRALQLVVMCGPCHLDALCTGLALEFPASRVTKGDLTRSDWFNRDLLD